MRSTLSLFLLVAACGGGKPSHTTAPPPPPEPVAEPVPVAPPAAPTKPIANSSLQAIGLDPLALDRKADPCTDFYQFACGGWIAKTEIPADKTEAMRSFVDIQDRNLAYEHDVLEKMREKPADAVEKQLSAYYGSCMDEAAIEKSGTKPIAPLLALVAKVKNGKSLGATVIALHAQGMSSTLFDLSPVQDSADARNMIANVDQSGLGLPDRDYYLKDDAQNKKIRDAYLAYITDTLVAIGHTPDAAKTETQQIWDLETAIAKISKDRVTRRDPKGMYNKIGKAGVAKAMPDFDWTAYWKAMKLDKVADITVTSPEFLAGLDALLGSTKPEVWRAYLTYHVVSSHAAILPKSFRDRAFAFRAAITGQEKDEERWKKCAASTDGALGDLLGQVFVRDRFPGDSKRAAEEQVGAIVAAMTANLDALPWMDKDTKVKAAAKLVAMSYQIGFPKKWLTYDFKLDPKTWAANSLAASLARQNREIAKIGKPVNKDDWQMTAPAVNAYYDPQLNGMVFPAGILQPPFYSVDHSIPVNLGGMGVVVGHELTHGFDDQGAQYDADGNLKDWWQPETAKLFKARTQCVIDQYSQYEVAGGTKLNGANTVGENIADIGGVKLALTAYRQLRSKANDTVVADGFTEDQQFFLGFGQAWCSKARPDFEKMLATIDEHSAPKWRVNGALSDTPEFAKVWSCKAGAKMAPVKACQVW
jgi:putative endopeptidase